MFKNCEDVALMDMISDFWTSPIRVSGSHSSSPKFMNCTAYISVFWHFRKGSVPSGLFFLALTSVFLTRCRSGSSRPWERKEGCTAPCPGLETWYLEEARNRLRFATAWGIPHCSWGMSHPMLIVRTCACIQVAVKNCLWGKHLFAAFFVLFYAVLVCPHLDDWMQFWAPQYKKDITLMDNIQRRTMKMVKALKGKVCEEQMRSPVRSAQSSGAEGSTHNTESRGAALSSDSKIKWLRPC